MSLYCYMETKQKNVYNLRGIIAKSDDPVSFTKKMNLAGHRVFYTDRRIGKESTAKMRKGQIIGVQYKSLSKYVVQDHNLYAPRPEGDN